MTTRFFTSDQHFGHNKVAVDIRGYKSTEEHNDDVIKAWNRKVKKDDQVFVLGDFSLKTPDHPDFENWVQSLAGRKFLIWGNHDAGFGMHRDAHRYVKKYLDAGFESVAAYGRVRIGGVSLLLSHFPYSGDHTEGERYTQYRLRDERIPLIHGHTHLNKQISNSTKGTYQFHVGWDAWGSPVSENVLLGMMEGCGLVSK